MAPTYQPTPHSLTYPELDKEESLLRPLLKDVLQTTALSRELVRNVTDINRLQVDRNTAGTMALMHAWDLCHMYVRMAHTVVHY